MTVTVALPSGVKVTWYEREEWGFGTTEPGWDHGPGQPILPVRYAILHHTGSLNYPLTDPLATARALHAGSLSKGYDGIEYSWIIGPQGRIVEGAGWDTNSASTAGNVDGVSLNNISFTFCASGCFGWTGSATCNMQPTDPYLEAVAQIIAAGVHLGKISRDAPIIGHRDAYTRDEIRNATATVCPGDNIAAKLPSIRARVAELLAPPPPVPPASKETTMAIIKGDKPFGTTPLAPWPGNGDSRYAWLPVVHPVKGYVFAHVDDSPFFEALLAAAEVHVIAQAKVDPVEKITAQEYRDFLKACTAVTPPTVIPPYPPPADLTPINTKLDALATDVDALIVKVDELASTPSGGITGGEVHFTGPGQITVSLVAEEPTP